MSRLRGRLRKLEAFMTDDRGLIPHSPRWRAYWMSQMERLMAGVRVRTPLRESPANPDYRPANGGRTGIRKSCNPEETLVGKWEVPRGLT